MAAAQGSGSGSNTTLKQAWPVLGCALLGAGLSYLAYNTMSRKKKAGSCCGGHEGLPTDEKSGAELDASTLSNYDAVRVQSMHLNLSADFERKVLSGFVDLRVKVLTAAGTKQLVLDTRTLKVSGAALISATKPKEDLPWAIDAKADDVIGQALTVQLPAGTAVGSALTVRVVYETTPASSAIQWLPKEQTAGKRHPYLFTQCQAIHARSFFPCQDTPAVKATYTATVTVPAPLVALMSAVSTTSNAADAKHADGKANTTTYHFEQKVCTPSYLVALAIGALEKRDISQRCAVWSEKETVDAGLHEFAETEKFLKAAEDICGPYVWGRYDVLLLPPSFPYGGMENPCLTFVTPTLLAGDRSLANVVAHEIAHSWMGNLVTNATWAHFWMNEGFTVFVERKILQKLYGKQMRDLHASTGNKHLTDDVNRYMETGHASFSRLVPPIAKGTDPDDVFSSVPYERGFQLLFHLEQLIGESNMAAYIKYHVKQHAYGHVSTDSWITEFTDFCVNTRGVDPKVLQTVDWKAWQYQDGMPPVAPKFDPTLIEAARTLAVAFADGQVADTFAGADFKSWSAAQVAVCLEKLEDLQSEAFAAATKRGGADALNAEKAKWRANLKAIDAQYQFTASKNSEIRFCWLKVGLRSDWEHVFPATVQFLTSQGRMKYTRPLYRELFKSKGASLAVETFTAHASTYHAICAKMVARDLGLAK